MSQQSAFSRFIRAARAKTARLKGGHLLAIGATAAVAVGLAGLRAYELPGPRPITDGEQIRIEVVQPVEPEIVAGSVMDVGEVEDGFQGLPPPLPPLTDVSWSPGDYSDGGDDGYVSSRSDERRRVGSDHWRSRPEPEPERESPVRAVQRWFGFDAPRRDYQAERAARRERMEALDRRAREDRETRRREWLDRQAARDEWRDDRRERDRDRERWRDADREYDRPALDPRPYEEFAEREPFTGPQ